MPSSHPPGEPNGYSPRPRPRPHGTVGLPESDLLGTRKPTPGAGPWLTYRETADYCGWTVTHLRNLVSAGAVPVYGKPGIIAFAGTC